MERAGRSSPPGIEEDEEEYEGNLLDLPIFKSVVPVSRDESGDLRAADAAGDEDWGGIFRSYSRRLTKELDEDGSAMPVSKGAGSGRGRNAYHGSDAARPSGGEGDSEGEGGDEKEDREGEGGDPSVRSPLFKLKAGALKYGVVSSMARGRRSSDSTLVTSDMLRRRLSRHGLHPPAAGGGAGLDDDAQGSDDAAAGEDGEGRKRGPSAAAAGQEAEEVDDDAMNGSFSDYKRGKRFRKLTKMLGSVQVGTIWAGFCTHRIPAHMQFNGR